MIYSISRDGQRYGPYTEDQVRQYLLSGNILLTDLVQPEGFEEWALVGALFAAYVAQTPSIPAVTPPRLPDRPEPTKVPELP